MAHRYSEYVYEANPNLAQYYPEKRDYPWYAQSWITCLVAAVVVISMAIFFGQLNYHATLGSIAPVTKVTHEDCRRGDLQLIDDTVYLPVSCTNGFTTNLNIDYIPSNVLVSDVLICSEFEDRIDGYAYGPMCTPKAN